MGLVITKESVQKEWTYTETGWELTGNSQHAVNNAIQSFNCQIMQVDGDSKTYVGNATGYLSGETLKVNINDCALAILADASLVVSNLITALEAVN